MVKKASGFVTWVEARATVKISTILSNYMKVNSLLLLSSLSVFFSCSKAPETNPLIGTLGIGISDEHGKRFDTLDLRPDA